MTHRSSSKLPDLTGGQGAKRYTEQKRGKALEARTLRIDEANEVPPLHYLKTEISEGQQTRGGYVVDSGDSKGGDDIGKLYELKQEIEQ